MSVAKEQIQRLERDMRRLREAMLVLAIALVATLAWSVTHARPDELTLRRLAIVDDEGRERIVAATRPEGDASVQHFDAIGRQRINVGTGPNGEAVLVDDGRDEKTRIGAIRFPDGYSGIALRSSNGESVWMKTSE